MAFKLEFETDNASFRNPDDAETEIVRCLMRVAERVQAGILDGAIYDSNGNHIGGFKLKGN